MGVALCGCADTVTGYTDAGPRVDADAGPRVDAADVAVVDDYVSPDIPGALFCPATLSPCRTDADCPSDCARYCTLWISRSFIPYIFGESACFAGFRESCGTGLQIGSLCPPGFVCAEQEGPGGAASSGCIQPTDCIVYNRSFQPLLPRPVVGERRCMYTDQTYPIDGRPRAATCLVGTGFQSCGLGCPDCPTGQSCYWFSERSPTGVCVTHPFARNPGEEGAPCDARSVETNCASPGLGCVFPIRHDVDRTPDEYRTGVCRRVAACREIAAAMPDAYGCREHP